MKYAYIEITENCNLACPFCPSPSLKSRGEMPLELFERILSRLKGNVREIFLHVLGEPLLHSRFSEILELSGRDFRVNLTTNGTLIDKFAERLLRAEAIRQVNFSTHAYAYLPKDRARKHLDSTIRFAREAAQKRPDIYINFRLWNDSADNLSDNWNSAVIETLEERFDKKIPFSEFSARHKSIPIENKIYLHRDSRFAWPDGNGERSAEGTCHGIVDQCAVLFDGTVVPCCLDFKGNVALGNFPENTFDEIFNGKKARAIANGFAAHKRVHPFCQGCAFAKRFK